MSSTDFALDWFKGNRPLLYEHGLDDTIGMGPLGYIKTIDEVAEGLWITAQMNKRHDYFVAVAELMSADALGFSSGSIQHLASKNDVGIIKSWPLIEVSLTTSPVNPFAKISSIKSFRVLCEENGVDITPNEQTDTTPQRDDADYIWIQKVRMQHGI